MGRIFSYVNADTAGGSIAIELDTAGAFSVEADTTGGGVDIAGLNFEAVRQKRSYARGDINGGGAQVRADTVGGSIRIHAAHR